MSNGDPCICGDNETWHPECYVKQRQQCAKCQGTGKDTTRLPIRAKVPGTIPGLDRYKLVQPLCDKCGGTGKKIVDS
jgi:hypothetical protein